MRQISIEQRVIDNKEYTAICIGEVSGELPRHLLSGTQEAGYTYMNGKLEPIFYTGVRDINSKRYIIYEKLDLLIFSEIAHSLREMGKVRIVELSCALRMAGNDFLQSESGIIPTWRIFWIASGGVLLLPERISSLILYSASDEERSEHLYRYMKPNLLPPFALTHQLTQILYYSATGIAPYELPETRELQWTHIPLSLGISGLDPVMGKAIDSTLNMKLNEQRLTYSSAYSASDNLSHFESLFEGLNWNITKESPYFEESVKSNSTLNQYMEKITKKAHNKLFFRKKGVAIIVTVVSELIVLITLVQFIIKANEPPYTSGMNQIEVVNEFFVGQNELDIEKMNASLARGVKNPFESEVSSLFVNSRVRQAYEGINSILTPLEFNSQEKRALLESTLIYGVDNLTFKEVNESTLEVSYDFYLPGLSSEERSGYPLTIINKRVKFTFTHEKGYQQIESIEVLDTQVIHEEIIPTYTK